MSISRLIVIGGILLVAQCFWRMANPSTEWELRERIQRVEKFIQESPQEHEERMKRARADAAEARIKYRLLTGTDLPANPNERS